MNKIKKSIAVLGAVTLLISCGEEQQYFPKIQTASGAHVKFVHAASDTVGVAFYINDAKISSGATLGSVIGYAGAFPVTDYTSLNETAPNFKVIVPIAANKVMISSDLALTEGNYYTVAFAGVTTAYEKVVIDDPITTVPFDGQSYIRFVNLIHNSTNNVTVVATPLSGDLTPITIAENVPYKGVVTFSAQLPRAYTIRLLDAITPATILATASAANGTLVGNKVYTLFARGQISGTAAKVPTLDRMVNR